MKSIHIVFSDERLITPSGLVFVGQILGKSSFVKKINRASISSGYLQKQIKNGDILLAYLWKRVASTTMFLLSSSVIHVRKAKRSGLHL